jgi:ankyrin repeat protein
LNSAYRFAWITAYLTLETPLIEAAQMNRTDMVELLLNRGANPAARDVMDRSALD